jgi:hypothetical protein
MRHARGLGRSKGFAARLAALLAVLALQGLTACGTDPAPVKKADAGGTQDVAVEDGVEPGADATDQEVLDTEVDAVLDGSDAKVGDAVDTGPTGCVSDLKCFGKLPGLKACEVEACDIPTGKCKAVPKPGTCCNDSDCNDNIVCTTDKCDLATSKCQNAPIPACDSNQQTLLKIAFEQKSVEGFKQTPDPINTNPYPNGNAKWQLETKRAHSGKTSLYFGNECYSYDTSMLGANDCKTGGSGQPVFTTLKFPDFTIAAGQLAILDFWLWLDTEPGYTTIPPAGNCGTAGCKKDQVCADLGVAKGGSQCVPAPLPVGNCKAPCNAGETCVDLSSQGAGSQCLPEKDVVKIKINDIVQWDSTKIGKTTGGKWVHIPLSLASGGQAPVITLEFATSNGLKNNYEGIYIDDVRVQTVSGNESFLCNSKKPCVDDKLGCTVNDCTYLANQVDSGLCYFDKTPACCEGVADCDDANNCTVDACKIASGATQGTCGNIPDSSNDQCCKPANLSTDDFTQGNLAGWEHKDGNSSVVNWKLNPKCESGACMYFGTADFSSYDDPALGTSGPKETVCSKPIALQQGTIYDVLSFNLRMDTEWNGQLASKYLNPPVAGTPKVDVLSVIVKPEGSAQTVWTSDAIQGTTGGKYLPISVALDAFQGKSVKVCFSFDAGDSSGNKYPGIFVDDVKVDVACKVSGCSSALDPACAGKCDAVTQETTCVNNECGCFDKPGVCSTDAKCDDKDSCTDDKCVAGKCSNVLTSESCCSNKTPLGEDYEASAGKLPSGWTSKAKTGNAGGGTGNPYDANMKWSVSALKAAGTGTYSLYFGNNGTYNAGTNVPAGDAISPGIAIPKNGTSLVTFDLFLSTEWDPPVVFSEPPFGLVVDRLRVGLVDPTQTDPAKATTWAWSSYAIQGSTNGKWQSVVVAVPDVWKGKTIKLDFEFDAGTEKNNNHEGAYVDNVLVQTQCTKPLCIDDAGCMPTTGADVCKKYYCAKDATSGQTACKTDFKPGAGCCEATTPPLPTATFEDGKLDPNWTPTSEGCPEVKWQVTPNKKNNGKYEMYFGNAAVSNYDCPGLAVSGSLCTPPFALSNDLKKGANLTFKGWFGIEAAFELFQVVVTYQTAGGPTPEVVLDKNDPKKGGLLAPSSGQKCGGEYCAQVTRTVDLSKYKGKGNIVICFNFDSGDPNGNSKYEGVYLDDLQLNEPCQ